MYVRCDNRHCIPGLTMSTALTGNFPRECPGIIKTMHTGFRRVHVLHYANALARHEETGRYDCCGKICVVF